MIEARKLMALPALLTLLQPMRHRPTLKRLVQDHGHALTHRREGDRRRPFFSPEQFPARETTWPGTTAFDAAATLANGAPPRRPNRLHSCSAGDMLPCAVPLWPPGHMPPGASRVPRWTGNHPPSRPALGHGRGRGPPPTSPGQTPPTHPLRQWSLKPTGIFRVKPPLGIPHFST
jgi:hypothetical protein